MTEQPVGVAPVNGVVHRPSLRSVPETVQGLREAIEGAGARVFAVIDQTAEAVGAGLSLRATQLLIFGNPAAGTPVMAAAPVSALDLPLKILVWSDDDGQVWMTYLSGDWLAVRYGLEERMAAALSAPDAITAKLAR